MKKFSNILYIAHGTADEEAAMTQALGLAVQNSATLKILVICPAFPHKLAEYQENYISSLQAKVAGSLHAARAASGVTEAAVPVGIEVESGDTPAIRVIRHVLRHKYDLVIKQADAMEEGKGFKAIDMELLRKCPCALWLCRTDAKSQGDMRVAVAIDAEDTEPVAYDLSLSLLTLAQAQADQAKGALNIIACWDYPFEQYLRQSVWSTVPADSVNAVLEEARQEHHAALTKLMGEAGMTENAEVFHLRGRPEKLIPQAVEDQKIDLLVMGTVARTGIAGFTIGNTAENIVQKVRCSVLALKPNSFVSAVKAY